MPPDSPPAAAPVPVLQNSTAQAAVPPTLFELFLAFARMSLSGFGGVLAFARRAIVEQHRWMTQEEFNETFALCHFLPGPNIVNLSMVFGSRFRGIPGGIAAFTGLLAPPMLLVTALAALYSHFDNIDTLRHVLAGISCAAIGLLMSVIYRMMKPLLQKRDWTGLAILAAVFVAVGVLRWPLAAVLIVGIPVSMAITMAIRRRAAA